MGKEGKWPNKRGGGKNRNQVVNAAREGWLVSRSALQKKQNPAEKSKIARTRGKKRGREMSV